MVGDKLRFRFEKARDLRLLSHHDLMRCVERLMRRASIPFKMTQGFHPAPRLVFSLSLPLGVVGRNEVLELELTEPRDAEETLRIISQQAPNGLTFTSVKIVPMKASAVPRRVLYRFPVPADRIADAQVIADRLMASEEVWVDRHHPRPRQVNIRPFLRAVSRDAEASGAERGVDATSLVSEASDSPLNVYLDLWVTGTGTARAEEILKLLGIADLLDAGHVLERTELELIDETSDAPDGPPTGPAITRPLIQPLGTLPRDEEPSTAATWGLSPNGPVVE